MGGQDGGPVPPGRKAHHFPAQVLQSRLGIGISPGPLRVVVRRAVHVDGHVGGVIGEVGARPRRFQQALGLVGQPPAAAAQMIQPLPLQAGAGQATNEARCWSRLANPGDTSTTAVVRASR